MPAARTLAASRARPSRRLRAFAVLAMAATLLAGVPPAAAQTAGAATLVVVVTEAAGGDRVPGVYVAREPGAFERVATGEFRRVVPSPDGSLVAVLQPFHVVVADAPTSTGEQFPVAAHRASWTPDGRSVVAVGQHFGENGVWRLTRGEPPFRIYSRHDVSDGYVRGDGVALVVRGADGGTANGLVTSRVDAFGGETPVRPFAVPRETVSPSGSEFVRRGAAGGIVVEDFASGASRVLDNTSARRPVAWIEDGTRTQWIVWEETSDDVFRYGVLRLADRRAHVLGSGSAPGRVVETAIEGGGVRLAVFAQVGGAYELSTHALDGTPAPIATSRSAHTAANVGSLAYLSSRATPRPAPALPNPLPGSTDAPERVAFATTGGGSLSAGLYTARPDGTDLKAAWRPPTGTELPRVIGAGRRGEVAFATADGLSVVPWDGSAAPKRLVNVPVYAFDWSPSMTRLVVETDDSFGGTRLVVYDGSSARPIPGASDPSFVNEDWIRFVRGQGGVGSLETLLLNVSEPDSNPIPLVPAAVPGGAFSDRAPRFAYARDGHVYETEYDGRRRSLLSSGERPLAYGGGAGALVYQGIDAAGNASLAVLTETGAATLATGLRSVPAGALLANGTGLVAVLEGPTTSTIRHWTTLSGAGVPWATTLAGVRSMVAFRAYPVPTGTNAVAATFAVLPPIGRAPAVWTGTEALVFGGNPGTVRTADILGFDPAADGVTVKGAKLPTPREHAAAAWDGTYAYVFGGLGAGGALADIQRYDPATDTLRAMSARLPGPRWGASAIYDGRYVYLFGGHDGTRFLDQIVRYEPATDRIETLGTRLPTPRAETSAVWTGRDALVFGGVVAAGAGTGSVSDIVHFTPSSSSLVRSTATLPTNRFGTAAVWDGRYAYVFGTGSCCDVVNRVVRYAPVIRGLDEMSTVLPARYAMSAAWSGNVGILLGGHDGESYLSRAFLYDPRTDTVAPKPVAVDNATGGNGTTNGTTNVPPPPDNGTKPDPPKNETSTPPATPAGSSNVRGTVDLFPDRADAAAVVATGENGRALTLTYDGEKATWDTTGVRNGRYRVEARDANGTVIDSTEILVQNPRATPTELAVSSATGVAVTVGVGAIWGQIFGVLAGLKGWFLQVGEEEFKDRLRDKGVLGLNIGKQTLVTTAVFIFGAGALLGVASAYAEASDPSFLLGDFLEILPFVAITVGLFYLASVLFDHFYARHIGRESEFRLSGPGTIALTASTALFATPFGAPGFVEGSETEDRQLEGRRGLASWFVLLALVLPFALLFYWRYDVYEAGISTILMLAVSLTVPVSRMPGALVWRWRPWLWVPMLVGAMTLYAVSEFALGGPLLFAGVGAVGILGIAGVFLSERFLEKGLLENRRARARQRTAEREESIDMLYDLGQAASEGYSPPPARVTPPTFR